MPASLSDALPRSGSSVSELASFMHSLSLGTYSSSERSDSASCSKSDSGLGSGIYTIASLIPYQQVRSCISGNIPESIHTCVNELSQKIPFGIEWLKHPEYSTKAQSKTLGLLPYLPKSM